MSDGLVADALNLFTQFGFPILLPVAVIEGPAVAVIAGALVAAGRLDPVIAFALLVLADLIGDLGFYCLGRFAHAPIASRLGRILALKPERTAPFHQAFRDHDWKVLMIGKTQAFGGIVLYFAGASRMPLGRYFAANLAATLPKILLFQLFGYSLGGLVLRSTRYADYAALAFFGGALAVLIGVMFFTRRLWKKLAAGTPV